MSRSAFGTLVRYYLHRGKLTQKKLADELSLFEEETKAIDEATIKRLIDSELVTGLKSQARVYNMIELFQREQLIQYREQANELLETAGLSSLRERVPREAALLQWLPPRPASEAAVRSDLNPPNLDPPPPIIGREVDIEDARSFFDKPHNRLLTIVGAPGIGKTHLAKHIGWELRDSFAQLVYFVDLSTLKPQQVASDLTTLKLQQVARELAMVLGVVEVPSQPLTDSLVTVIGQQDLLLILDNVEHLVQETAVLVGQLLGKCRNLKLLITSRVPLEIGREQEYRLPPLPVPEHVHRSNVAMAMQAPAIELFVACAQAVKRNFTLNQANVEDVVAICSRLEGIPLAIELLARKIGIYAPHTLLKVLREQQLPLLTGGRRDLPIHDRAMETAIAASYILLQPDEQALLRRLSVLVGDWTVDTADAVCHAAGDLKIPTFVGIESLVRQSLIMPSIEVNGQERFRILEVISEFARSHWTTEEAQLPRRHAMFYLAQAEAAERTLQGKEQRVKLAWFETEHANLRAAVAWALAQAEAELAFKLVGSLWRFWWVHGHLSEGLNWLSRVLQRDARVPGAILTKALNGGAVLANALGDDEHYKQVLIWCERSKQVARAQGDIHSEVTAGIILGMSYIDQCRHREGITELTESVERCRQALNEPWTLAWGLFSLGRAWAVEGNLSRAEHILKESLDLCTQELNDDWLAARVFNWLGIVESNRGKHAAAMHWLQQGLELCQAVEDRLGQAYLLYSMAESAYLCGRYTQALAYTQERLTIEQTLGNIQGIANALSWRGYIGLAQGDFRGAEADLQESKERYKEVHHVSGIAQVEAWRGIIAQYQGNTAAAESALQESLKLYRLLADRPGEAHVLLCLIRLAYWREDYASAQQYNEERLAIETARENEQGQAHAIYWRGRIAAREDPEKALACFEQSLHMYECQKERRGSANVLRNIGLVARDQKRYSDAARVLVESMQIYDQLDVRPDVAYVLEDLAQLTLLQGRPEMSATLFGAAAYRREMHGIPLKPVEIADYERSIDAVRTALEPATFQAAWDKGRELPLTGLQDVITRSRFSADSAR